MRAKNRYHGLYINDEEYNKAIAILLAFAYENSEDDTLVELHNCDSDCTYNVFGSFCQGEFGLDHNSRKLCKHFANESLK